MWPTVPIFSEIRIFPHLYRLWLCKFLIIENILLICNEVLSDQFFNNTRVGSSLFIELRLSQHQFCRVLDWEWDFAKSIAYRAFHWVSGLWRALPSGRKRLPWRQLIWFFEGGIVFCCLFSCLLLFFCCFCTALRSVSCQQSGLWHCQKYRKYSESYYSDSIGYIP